MDESKKKNRQCKLCLVELVLKQLLTAANLGSIAVADRLFQLSIKKIQTTRQEAANRQRVNDHY